MAILHSHPRCVFRAVLHRAPAVFAALFLAGGEMAAAVAAEEPPTPRLSPIVMSDALQVALGLILVLVAIATTAWLVRRVFRFAPGVQGQVKVLSGVPMGPRERVVLLQVGETQLLIGVTPSQIHTLHVLDTPLDPDEAESAVAPAFVAHLRNALKPQGLVRRRS